MRIKLIDHGCPSEYYPRRAHPNDAGADVYALKNYNILPGTTVSIGLGFGIECPAGYAGFIFIRSKLAAAGLDARLPPVDPGYTGPLHAILYNSGINTYNIKRGDRIGQLVLLPVVTPDFEADFKETRGEGAFGSTGA